MFSHADPLTARVKDMEDLFGDSEFWADQKRLWMAVFVPILQAGFLDGVALGSVEAGRAANPKGPLDALALEPWGGAQIADPNEAALRYIRGYTDQWWDQFTTTTQRNLRSAIETARTNGLGPKAVAEMIAPDFGLARATRIAVTELTRVMGQGAQEEYRALGYAGWRWETVHDGIVCPECQAVDGKTFPMSVTFEPLHVNCRCFSSPVVEPQAAFAF